LLLVEGKYYTNRNWSVHTYSRMHIPSKQFLSRKRRRRLARSL